MVGGRALQDDLLRPRVVEQLEAKMQVTLVLSVGETSCDERSVSEDGCGRCGCDERSGACGLDDAVGSGGQGCSSDVRGCGHQWTLHGDFVGVGVAGGDGHGVRHRERCRGEYRRRVKSSRCRQVSWGGCRCRGG